jgi:hypothetical protein
VYRGLGGKRRHCKSRGLYIFYGKGNENYQRKTELFVHHRIVSAVKTVEFVSDRMPYTFLKDRWCNIIVLNVRRKVMIPKKIFVRN